MATLEPRDTRRAVCAIITKSFLAHARVLANSIAAHNPDVRIIVLLADRVDRCFEPAAESFEMITLDDIGARASVERMCFYYSAFELSCALRGLLHRYMQERTHSRSWLFLDGDMMVWGDLAAVFEIVERGSVTLTPHLLEADHLNYRQRPETQTTYAGIFNAGFVGVARDAALSFIDWFVNRLELFCFTNSGESFVDQRWLGLVPVFFPNTTILDHAGVNVAYWNLHERKLTKETNGHYLANGMPLLITHFSGLELDRPDRLSKWVPKSHVVPPLWRELSANYIASLRDQGCEAVRSYPYAFDYFEDGSPITPLMRRVYYGTVRNGTAAPQSPFAQSSHLRAQSQRAAIVAALQLLHPRHFAKVPAFLINRVVAWKP